MAQIIPIYIPTYISNATYSPARVLPRIFFYNGQVECEPFFIKNETNLAIAQNAFPYFDNYNVVSGSFPTDGSKSLLLNNEPVSYGSLPSASLYTEYWEKYISLLYNPKTRLLNCSAIIPLADYVKMELNDIVNFRGNYYHLRAINDYSLKTGECNLQLLGPIITDTFSSATPAGPGPSPTGSGYAEVSWSFIEGNGVNGEMRLYDNGSNVATLTSTGGGNARITASHVFNAELEIPSYPTTGSTTMSLFWNGDASYSNTQYTDTILTSSFTLVGGGVYYITGSVSHTPEPPGGAITFTKDTGTYPLSGTGTSCGGTIKNNIGYTIYVYGKFNSGGNTSGNVSSDGGNVSTTALSFTRTVSGSGQTIISTNYHTLTSDNTSYNWDLSKNDGMTSGASIRLAYSTSPGGTLTDLT